MFYVKLQKNQYEIEGWSVCEYATVRMIISCFRIPVMWGIFCEKFCAAARIIHTPLDFAVSLLYNADFLHNPPFCLYYSACRVV
jgi:hypothetical protein